MSEVKDFLVDSLALQDPTRFLVGLADYEFELKEYRYRTPDSLYWMHVKERPHAVLRNNKRYVFSGLSQKEPPLPERRNLTYAPRPNATAFDVKLNNIELAQLQPRLLLEHQIVWANKLTIITAATLDIYHITVNYLRRLVTN